jgi:hypothetical protein
VTVLSWESEWAACRRHRRCPAPVANGSRASSVVDTPRAFTLTLTSPGAARAGGSMTLSPPPVTWHFDFPAPVMLPVTAGKDVWFGPFGKLG